MYLLFLDESGDSNLKAIDPNHPVFALAGCIFEGNYYQNIALPKINNIKRGFFNSEEVILHSRDIRKQETEPFLVLRNKEKRKEFYKEWNALIANLDFTALASLIDKKKLKKKYGEVAQNPYHLSLGFLMERFSMFLRKKGDKGKIIIESRTKADDNRLYLAYSKKMLNGSSYIKSEEFQERIEDLKFVNKDENIVGTQVADLLAYPIATSIIPNRDKRAFKVIKPKFRSKNGEIRGFGLKIFP